METKWKAIAVFGVWVGYGIAMLGVAFGTANQDATTVVGTIGAVCALVATMVVCFEL